MSVSALDLAHGAFLAGIGSAPGFVDDNSWSQ